MPSSSQGVWKQGLHLQQALQLATLHFRYTSNVAFQIYFRLSYHSAGTPLFDEKGKAEVGPADSIRNRVYKAFNDLNMLTLRLRRILG